MNYARLNFLQLDRLEKTRLSWGALCYEIARDSGACMHFDNAEHRRLVDLLRGPGGTNGLEDVAAAVLRGLDAAEDAESLPVELESLIGTVRVLSPVAVKTISAALAALDERRLQALLDRVAPSAINGAGGAPEAIASLVDFYRRAASRGQYLLLAEMAD